MADELELFEFLESDYQESTRKRRRERQFLRAQADPFELEDAAFIRRYRLSKELVKNLVDELKPMLREPTRAGDLTVETKVLTALSFYATGSYQRPTGDIGTHSLAQQTVSTAISQITACIDSPQMRRKNIVFPLTAAERNATRVEFDKKFKLPGVLGCIDGTHVAIIKPTQFKEKYNSRKHYHSLNVQLICDANMQITSVVTGFGGATPDAFIWDRHPLKAHLESLDESTWLLGDSGYPLKRYMMTPIVNAAPNTPERHYNGMHVLARKTIANTIGVLKARFRCLGVHKAMHYTPEKAASIVNACTILHNICNKENLPVEKLSYEEALKEANIQDTIGLNQIDGENVISNPDLQLGQSARRDLVARLWKAKLNGIDIK